MLLLVIPFIVALINEIEEVVKIEIIPYTFQESAIFIWYIFFVIICYYWLKPSKKNPQPDIGEDISFFQKIPKL